MGWRWEANNGAQKYDSKLLQKYTNAPPFFWNLSSWISSVKNSPLIIIKTSWSSFQFWNALALREKKKRVNRMNIFHDSIS